VTDGARFLLWWALVALHLTTLAVLWDMASRLGRVEGLLR
jgi:hypothetical protein